MQEGEIMRESHSLNFTDSQGNVKNTYKDYHLIAKGKPSINPPEVQTEYVEILGRNGLLDMTGGVDGKVYFKNMEAEWSFIVDPRFDYYNIFHRLLRDLHGKKFDIVLVEDDPYATYVGRLTVSQPALGEHFNEVTITANIDPNYTRTADNYEKYYVEPVITVSKLAVNPDLVYFNSNMSWSNIRAYETYIGKTKIAKEQEGNYERTYYIAYIPLPADIENVPIPANSAFVLRDLTTSSDMTISDFTSSIEDSIFEGYKMIVSKMVINVSSDEANYTSKYRENDRVRFRGPLG